MKSRCIDNWKSRKMERESQKSVRQSEVTSKRIERTLGNCTPLKYKSTYYFVIQKACYDGTEGMNFPVQRQEKAFIQSDEIRQLV